MVPEPEARLKHLCQADSAFRLRWVVLPVRPAQVHASRVLTADCRSQPFDEGMHALNIGLRWCLCGHFIR